MPKLAQQLIDNAKQVYIHLGLFSKQHCLTTTELDKLPIEIQKMNLLYCTDPAELTKVVRHFLQTSQRAKQRSTLNDLVRAVDGALNSICAAGDDDDNGDDWVDNDLNSFNLDDATPAIENDSTIKKRLLQESNATAPTTKRNKRLHDTPTATDMANPVSSEVPLTDEDEYPKLLYHLQLQKDNSKFEGFNVIASPPDPLAIIEEAPMVFQIELARFMTSCCIPWHHLDLDTAQKFLDLARNNPAKVHDVMMAWHSDFCRSGSNRVPMNERLWNLLSLERCAEAVWKYGMDPTINDTEEPADVMAGGKMAVTKSLRYTAKIQLPDNKDEEPTIQLNIPRIHSSNRFFRKFGAERFLELRLPKVLAPEAISEHTAYILRPFLLMGRTYRFLFIKDDRLILFATEGPGITSISLHSVINWHIPIMDNWALTTCKFASRMSLGYSNSISTLTFDPGNVRYIDDVFAPGRPRDDNSCMTDGCGIISASAMRKIMGSQQNDIMPCAIQGRIGGAKGLWIVSPDLDMDSGDWIEIRSSQKKFTTGLPDPMLANTLDPIHFTFDLVKNAFCLYPSHLNTQFIQCLAAGGVPVQVFLELLTEHIGNVSDILTDIRNTQVLRDWLVKSGGIQGRRQIAEGLGQHGQQRQVATVSPPILVAGDDHDDGGKSGPTDDHDTTGATSKQSGMSPINDYSGLPSSLYESIVRLLDAGFDLTNAYIANRTTFAFRGMLTSLSTKYRVEIQQSCTLMCIPDPTGLLKPNQVFLQLSNRRIDEKTGVHAGLITGDILVSRNPCGLKSDFQKVQAVDCSALRVYSDVIVFPTQGARSMASKLSGGDYDGDLIFCCWDRRVVEPFLACPVPDTHPRVSIVFERDSRKVCDELRHMGGGDDQAVRLQQLFLTVPTYDGTLGIYENWRTVISEMDTYGTEDGIYLAQMCALLVDAPKQGYKLKFWAKKDDRAKYSSRPVPAWFLEKLKKTRESDDMQPSRNSAKPADRPLTTAMDFLHSAIQREIEKLAKTPQSLIPEDLVTRKDNDLAFPWNKAMETAKALGDEAMQMDLDTIRDAVEVNFNNYTQDVRDVVAYLEQKADSQWTSTRSQQEASTKMSSANANGPRVLGECINRFSSFLQIEQHYAKLFHEMAMDSLVSTTFKMDIKANEGRLVQTLKASCAYLRTVTKGKYNKYCYVVAYDALARIKSDVCAKKTKLNGICNTVVPSIYPALTMDRGWIRKYKDIRLLGK